MLLNVFAASANHPIEFCNAPRYRRGSFGWRNSNADVEGATRKLKSRPDARRQLHFDGKIGIEPGEIRDCGGEMTYRRKIVPRRSLAFPVEVQFLAITWSVHQAQPPRGQVVAELSAILLSASANARFSVSVSAWTTTTGTPTQSICWQGDDRNRRERYDVRL